MWPFKNKHREEQFDNKQRQKEEEDKEAAEQNQIFFSIKQLVEIYQFRAGQTEWSQAIEEHICSKLDTLKYQCYKDQLIELITMKSRVYGVRPMNIGDGEAYKQWLIQHKLKELEGDFEDAR